MKDKTIKVLLIEDNFNYAQLVRIMLAKAKGIVFDLEWSDCLSKGLERLATGGIDVVLLDLQLPDSGGIDTFVGTHIQVPNIPIIVLTGNDDEALAVKALQMGAQDYLFKAQVDSNHLVRSIRYAIERHQRPVKQLTQELHPNEVYFRNNIENNADGITIVDKSGIVRYVNPATEVLFGRKAEELVGEFFGFPLVTGKETEIDIIRRSGETIEVEMHVVGIKWEGETAYLASLRDITERKRMEEALRNLTFTDDLTGLYNRRGFLNLAEQHLKLAQRKKREFLVVFIDLDGLKQINDTFGHHEGNQALIETVEILRGTFRESDIIARLGGDEFVVLAIDASDDSADIITNRLRKNIEAHNAKDNRRYKLSTSMGIARYDPKHPCSIDELLTQADKLMYEHKQSKQDLNSGKVTADIPNGTQRK